MGLELADIARRYGSAYQERYGDRLLPSHRRALRAIEQCRTEALGGHIYTCPQCDQVQYRYHSCRNRHCPKCQHEQAQAWLEEQQSLLLPVPYFLLTFTLPAGLRRVTRRHQRFLCDLLFRTSAGATQRLARDPRFIGGQVGLTGVLHTWTRDLRYHPHVHYLVPAGGLASDGETWLPARRNFLIPVRALSRLFRSHFRQALRKDACFGEVPAEVWTQEWVVHIKPVGSGHAALKYLAPYIFRVALSNRRLVRLENDRVTFRYTDSRTAQTKLCTLPVHEFLHRFLQHVLPKGFVKVRYYGFFSPGNRTRLGALQRRLELHAAEGQSTAQVSSPASQRPVAEAIVRCPNCGHPMEVRIVFPAQARYPP